MAHLHVGAGGSKPCSNAGVSGASYPTASEHEGERLGDTNGAGEALMQSELEAQPASPDPKHFSEAEQSRRREMARVKKLLVNKHESIKKEIEDKNKEKEVSSGGEGGSSVESKPEAKSMVKEEDKQQAKQESIKKEKEKVNKSQGARPIVDEKSKLMPRTKPTLQVPSPSYMSDSEDGGQDLTLSPGTRKSKQFWRNIDTKRKTHHGSTHRDLETIFRMHDEASTPAPKDPLGKAIHAWHTFKFFPESLTSPHIIVWKTILVAFAALLIDFATGNIDHVSSVFTAILCVAPGILLGFKNTLNVLYPIIIGTFWGFIILYVSILVPNFNAEFFHTRELWSLVAIALSIYTIFIFRLNDTVSASFSGLYVVLVMYNNPIETLVIRLKSIAAAVFAAMVVNAVTSVFYYKRVFTHKVIYAEAMTVFSLGKLNLQPIHAMHSQVIYELDVVHAELRSRIYFFSFFDRIRRDVEDMRSQMRHLQFLLHLYKHIVYQDIYAETLEQRYYAREFYMWLGSLHYSADHLSAPPIEARKALEPCSTHLLVVLSDVLSWKRNTVNNLPVDQDAVEEEVDGFKAVPKSETDEDKYNNI